MKEEERERHTDGDIGAQTDTAIFVREPYYVLRLHRRRTHRCGRARGIYARDSAAAAECAPDDTISSDIKLMFIQVGAT